MTKKPLTKQSRSKRLKNNFFIFRLFSVAVLVGVFSVLGLSVKDTLADWSEPSAPPPAGNVSAPIWNQTSTAQSGGFYLNGNGRFDTTGTGDVNCSNGKVCGVDAASSGGAHGVVGESNTGYGVYASSTSNYGLVASSGTNYAGYFSGNVYVFGALNATAGLQVDGTDVCLLDGTNCPSSGGYWSLNGTNIYNNNAGNVGIGTTIPAAKLNIYNQAAYSSSGQEALRLSADYAYATVGSGAKLMFYNGPTAASTGYIWSAAESGNVGLQFGTGYTTTTTKMTITGSGDVGIGTKLPVARLTIWDNATDESQMIRLGNTAVADYRIFRQKNDGILRFDGTQTTYSSFLFSTTAAASALSIINNGNVGIGTTTPVYPLEIKATQPVAQFTWTDNTQYGSVVFKENTTSKGAFQSIGSNYSDATRRNAFELLSFGASSFISFLPNGAEKMRIMPSGYVGIGQTNPGSALDVKGTFRLSGATSGYVGFVSPAAPTTSVTYTLPSADGTSGYQLTTNGTGTLSWAAAGGSQTPWTANVNAAGFTLQGNSTSGGDLTLDSTSNATKGDILLNPSGGNVGIGNSTPAATLSLGTAGTRAGSLYLAGATTNGVTVNVPASVTTAYTITLPSAAPTVNGQALTATTAGVASWTTVSGGSQTPWASNINAAGYTLQGNSTASGNMTIDSTSSATKGYVLLNPTGGNVGIGNSTPTASLSLGTAGTRLGSMTMAGNTSGTVTITPAAAAGTWTMTLPTTAGTSGQYLQTNGSGTTTWAAAGGGSQTPWTANVNAAGFTLQGNSTASGNLTLDSTSSATKGYVLLNPSGGNVGIGTTTPNNKLQVAGLINFDPLGENTFLGNGVGAALTTGSENTAVGSGALYDNSDGDDNVAIGQDALANNTIADSNVAIGTRALRQNTTGQSNIAIGTGALSSNTSGDNNGAFGLQTLARNTTGHDNTGVGSNSLVYNTTGYYNNTLGFESLFFNTTGSRNTAVGIASLYYNTTGNSNTAIGEFSGFNSTTPLQNMFSNTFIGANANSSVDGTSYSTALGWGAQITKSYQMVIGGGWITETLLYGNVGIGKINPAVALDVQGSVKVSGAISSDSIVSSAPANPCAITNTAGRLLGLNLAFTPKVSGKYLILVTGMMGNSTVGSITGAQLRVTSTSNSCGAADAGSAYGKIKNMTASTAAGKQGVALSAVVSGAVVGTTYYIDVLLKPSAGTANLYDIDMIAQEL